MKPITHILVPIDFSAGSEQAVQHALTLARALGARIELLTVVPPPAPLAAEVTYLLPVEGLSYSQYAEKQALQALVDLHAGLAVDDVQMDLTAQTGHPRTTIVATAAEADLVVMGTHGRSGLSRLLLGSVAEYVVRHAPCPVTTVRAPRDE